MMLEKTAQLMAQCRYNAGSGERGILAAPSALTDIEDPQLLAAMEIGLSKEQTGGKKFNVNHHTVNVTK